MLKVSEVAALLGLGENAIRRLDAKLLPRRLADGSRSYTRRAVDKLAAQRRARRAPALKKRERILARVDERGRK